MCGIAGIVDYSASADDLSRALSVMADRMAHRGPDGAGIFTDAPVGLAHRRLSIIDIEGGKQPFSSADGTVHIILNGEIYNYREIRRELENENVRFSSSSDTEALLYAYKEWGLDECLRRLRGMYAFAVWDKRSQELFLVRDPFGIKPLYYAELGNGGIAFASEIGTLLSAVPTASRTLRSDAIIDFFSLGYIPDPKTILNQVHRLEAGCYLHHSTRRRSGRVSRYWNLNSIFPPGGTSRPLSPGRISEILSESVTAHLVADVPVGAFLSGGIDSSAVVNALAEETRPSITAFTIGFDDARFDETRYAEQVASLAGIPHQVKRVSCPSQEQALQTLGVYGEPFADSSAIPTLALCKAVSESCKVALSGDGGDETFIGYPWYRTQAQRARIRSLLPEFVLTSLSRTGNFLRSRNAFKSWPGMGFLASLGGNLPLGLFENQRLTTAAQLGMLLNTEFSRSMSSYSSSDLYTSLARESSIDHPVRQAQYIDMRLYLCSDLLVKVDRASMAHGLEVRVPFIDTRVIGGILEHSPEALMAGGKLKGALKQHLRASLPDSLLDRPKQGFSAPLDSWFRGGLGDTLTLKMSQSRAACYVEVLDLEAIRGILDLHRRGKGTYGAILWAVLAFCSAVERVLAE